MALRHLTGGREAEDGGQAYETAGCLSEASFLPFSLNAGRSSPMGTAGALSFWYLFLSGKRKKKYTIYIFNFIFIRPSAPVSTTMTRAKASDFSNPGTPASNTAG